MALKPLDPRLLIKAKKGLKIDPQDRTYTTWFKLTHRFIQVIPGLPQISNAVCSNPDCPNKHKEKGAVSTVAGLDMCRECFMAGYGLPTNNTTTDQLTLNE